MRWLARSVLLAAAISIVAAAVPEALAAGQPTCQPGAGPSAPDPTTAGGVNVHVTKNNAVVWCSAAVIEANKDVADGTHYQVQSGAVSPNDTPVSNAISVGGLLTLAGLTVSNLDHVSIARLNGSLTTLNRADLVDPANRFQGGLQPIFWINGSETQYLRPLRSASDANADDQIVASNGDPLDIYVYSGPLLNVAGTATPNHAAPSQRITLTARVSNPTQADGKFIYTWTFQDGVTATGAAVTHAYSVTGNWYPVVTVRGLGDNSGGASQPIPVTVGRATQTPRNPSGGSGSQKDTHVGGPNHSGGTTPNTSQANKNAAGTGAAKPVSRNGTPAQPANSGSSQAATQSTPSATSSPGATPNARATRPRRRTTARRFAHRQPAAGQTRVEGRLIADVIPVSADELAQENRRPPQVHAPSARAGGGTVTPLAGIAGGSAIALLLGAGAALELRTRRRPVGPPRAS